MSSWGSSRKNKNRESLPGQLGYGSGWTCWRRMRDRQQAGVFDRLGRQGLLDWSRASLDSASVRAKRG